MVFIGNVYNIIDDSFLVQRHRELWKAASFCLPIMYFGYKGVNTDRAWPNDIIRAFVCMALGTISFMITERVREYNHDTSF